MSDIIFAGMARKHVFNNGGEMYKLNIDISIIEKYKEFQWTSDKGEQMFPIDLQLSKNGNWYIKVNDYVNPNPKPRAPKMQTPDTDMDDCGL